MGQVRQSRLGPSQRNQIKVLDLSYKIKLVYRGDMRVYFRESKVFRKTQEEFYYKFGIIKGGFS